MRAFRTGLVLAAVLGVADIAAAIAGGGDTPPLPIAVAAAALGLITLVAAGYGWQGRRGAVVTVVVTRVLSALGAVPAFFAADVSAAFVASAAVLVVLTIAVVLLLVPRLRRQQVAA